MKFLPGEKVTHVKLNELSQLAAQRIIGGAGISVNKFGSKVTISTEKKTGQRNIFREPCVRQYPMVDLASLMLAVNEREEALGITETEFTIADGTTKARPVAEELIGFSTNDAIDGVIEVQDAAKILLTQFGLPLGGDYSSEFVDSEFSTDGLVFADVIGGINEPKTHYQTGEISSYNNTVTGVGTTFLNKLEVGDIIEAWGQQRTVLGIASNTELTVDTAFTPALDDASFFSYPVFSGTFDSSANLVASQLTSAFSNVEVGDQISVWRSDAIVSSIKNNSALYTSSPLGAGTSGTEWDVTFPGTGTISISSGTATGSGTLFTKELRVGDRVYTINGHGLVNSITSDTDLTFSFPWPLDGSGLDFDIPRYYGSGTISSSGTDVTGSGTAFTTELRGTTILADGESRIIDTVTDATNLTVTSAWTTDLSGEDYLFNPNTGSGDIYSGTRCLSGNSANFSHASEGGEIIEIDSNFYTVDEVIHDNLMIVEETGGVGTHTTESWALIEGFRTNFPCGDLVTLNILKRYLDQLIYIYIDSTRLIPSSMQKGIGVGPASTDPDIAWAAAIANIGSVSEAGGQLRWENNLNNSFPSSAIIYSECSTSYSLPVGGKVTKAEVSILRSTTTGSSSAFSWGGKSFSISTGSSSPFQLDIKSTLPSELEGGFILEGLAPPPSTDPFGLGPGNGFATMTSVPSDMTVWTNLSTTVGIYPLFN